MGRARAEGGMTETLPFADHWPMDKVIAWEDAHRCSTVGCQYNKAPGKALCLDCFRDQEEGT